jgi:hypothetical protein
MEPGQAIANAYEKLKVADAERATAAAQPAPPQPQQGAAVQAQIPLPGQLQAPNPAPPNPQGGQVYAGGTPEGGLSSTPRQATADTLNNLETGKGLDTKQGDVESEGLAQQAAAETAAADEVRTHETDYNDLLNKNTQAHEKEHNERVAVHQNYLKAAGSLKDPGDQFWEDKGQGARVVASLASFASGMGAGLLGHAGNPFMEHLQKSVDNNYQAHKQNIDDLYRASVESGKILDTEDNHRRFDQNAKLQSYDFSIEHLKHVLNGVKNSSASQVAKVMSDKAVAGLTQEQIAARQNLGISEAKAAANANSGQRARQAAVDADYNKFLEMHTKDMGPAEARAATLEDLKGKGYNASDLASKYAGQGITADPATGQYTIPKPADSGSSEAPHYDDATGKLIVPTKTAQGKNIDTKDQEAMTKDLTEKTAKIDGKNVIFNRKEEAEAATSIPEAERLFGVMENAYKTGDHGALVQAKKQLVELAPKLLGYKRGPSIPQAGESGAKTAEDNAEADRGTIAGQLPDFEVNHVHVPIPGVPNIPFPQGVQAGINNNPTGATNSEAGQALAKLRGFKDTLAGIKKEAMAGVRDAPNTTKEDDKKPKTTADLDELTKSLGGK